MDEWGEIPHDGGPDQSDSECAAYDVGGMSKEELRCVLRFFIHPEANSGHTKFLFTRLKARSQETQQPAIGAQVIRAAEKLVPQDRAGVFARAVRLGACRVLPGIGASNPVPVAWLAAVDSLTAVTGESRPAHRAEATAGVCGVRTTNKVGEDGGSCAYSWQTKPQGVLRQLRSS